MSIFEHFEVKYSFYETIFGKLKTKIPDEIPTYPEINMKNILTQNNSKKY